MKTIQLIGLTGTSMVGIALIFPSIFVQTAFSKSVARVEVSPAIKQDISAPLKSLKASVSRTSHRPARRLLLRPHGTSRVPNTADGAIQAALAGPLVGTKNLLNFAGVGQGDYGYSPLFAPPDTIGVVGATQYVQSVNADFAVFNKTTGAIVMGPLPNNAIWSGFGGGCEFNNDGDPIVAYDKAAKRWILSQFSVSTTPYLQCVAVSTTADATGTYNRYAFNYGNVEFPDYPKLGVWPDAYYISFNIFNNGFSFAGPKVCAYDRAKMLKGKPATQQCFQLSTSFGSLLPSDLDGKIAPPVGSPNYFLSFGNNILQLWKFHVDWKTPANTSLTGPTNIPVAAFSPACGGGACISQLGTTQKLDSLGDRLMNRLAYRNRSGTESLVVNHSVAVGTGAGVRWYELRLVGGSASVFQQSTFAPDSTSRWMGSIAMDKVGNIALGYSASSASINPAIRYTGRLVTDPLNTLQAEKTIINGAGSQNGGLERWGDYSSMTVDPVNDCTFWYTNEYLKANGSFNWSTRIAKFKFRSCK